MLEEKCPPTDRCPVSQPVKSKPIIIETVSPGDKNYANFKEFWDDPCWAEPLAGKSK